MPFVPLIPESKLPPRNEVTEVACGDRMICIANVNGVISAIDNVCLHHGGPLGQGVVHDGKVVCPWHGWEFDPKTGSVGFNPEIRVASYPLKIENGQVLIQVD
jgi:nitrite reductase/ring-hydroxylating ferredoxin subunit